MSKHTTVNGRQFQTKDLTIEPAYSNYANPEGKGFAIYNHFTYPSSSVLAGQSGRQHLDSKDTLEELTALYPGVEILGHTTYIDPSTVMPSGSPEDYEEPWDEE